MSEKPIMGNAVVRGRDIKVGDVIVFLEEDFRIREIEPYEHPTLGGARIAVSRSDWRITLWPDQLYEIA